MSELFTRLWTWYQAKPAQVTVLSSGALLVDANRLLSSEAAKKQIEALQNFPTIQTQTELPDEWVVRRPAADPEPQPGGQPAE